ncbi:MAG TPA: tetratricopeptide repeat protein, partial [Candidatus Caenarcaniphilales bacterium]
MSATTTLDGALQAYKQKRYAEAMQQFSNLAADHAKDPQIWMWLAAACREAGHIDEAKQHFQEVFRLTSEPKLVELARASLAQLENSRSGMQQNGTARTSSGHPRAESVLTQPVMAAAPVPDSSAAPALQDRQKSHTSLLQRLGQGWENLGFQTKLALLLVGSAAIPVIAVTQSLGRIAENRLASEYEAGLRQNLTILTDAVENAQDTNKVVAATMAKSLRESGIDLNQPTEVSARRKLLESIAEDPSDDLMGQSFH